MILIEYKDYFDIISVLSGEKAIEASSNNNFDIIFMDINMPN